MVEPRSHYDVLGVPRGATSAEIRAAYVRLMKHYHPDAKMGSEDAAIAPLLNHCYAILKDPKKRAFYDATLQRPPRAIAASRRSTLTVRQKRPVFTPGSVALVLLTCAATALTLGVVGQTERIRDDLVEMMSRGAFPLTTLPIISAAPATPDDDDGQRIASFVANVSMEEAVLISRSCFAAASRTAQLTAADTCVLFDVAFIYRHDPLEATARPAHFADQVVANRHKLAMLAFGSRAEARLAEIRETAFQAVIDTVATTRSETMGANLVGIQSGAFEQTVDTRAVPEWDGR